MERRSALVRIARKRQGERNVLHPDEPNAASLYLGVARMKRALQSSGQPVQEVGRLNIMHYTDELQKRHNYAGNGSARVALSA